MGGPDCAGVKAAVIDRQPLTPEMLEHVQGCSRCGLAARFSRLRDANPAAIDGPLAEALKNGTLILDQYRLEERVGMGAQGVVYRALDVVAGEHVALKAVAFAPATARRIAREVRNARNVAHPNVCRVHTC